MQVYEYGILANSAVSNLIQAHRASRYNSGNWAEGHYKAKGLIEAISVLEVEEPKYVQTVLTRLAALIYAERCELGEEGDWDNMSTTAIWTQTDLLATNPDVGSITAALDEAVEMIETGRFYAIGEFMAPAGDSDNCDHSHVCVHCWTKHPCEDILLLRPEGPTCGQCADSARF